MANLRGYIDDAVTDIQIDDTTGFPTNGGVVLIESELIRYTTATDRSILGCERGFNSTTAVEHQDKTAVVIQETLSPLYTLQEYNDHGTPVDHKTGIGFAYKGTRYTDLDSGMIYTNLSDELDPVWTVMATGVPAGSSGALGAIQLSDGAGGFDSSADLSFDDGDSSLHTNSIRMADGSTLFGDNILSLSAANQIQSDTSILVTGNNIFVEDGDFTVTNGNYTMESTSGQPGLVINESGVPTAFLTKNTGGGSLELNNNAGSVLIESAGNTQASFDDTNGVTISPTGPALITSDNDITLNANSNNVTLHLDTNASVLEMTSENGLNIDTTQSSTGMHLTNTVANSVLSIESAATNGGVRMWKTGQQGSEEWVFFGQYDDPSFQILNNAVGTNQPALRIEPNNEIKLVGNLYSFEDDAHINTNSSSLTLDTVDGTVEVQGRNDGYGELALRADGGYLGYKGNDGHYIARWNWLDTSYIRFDTKQAIPLEFHIDADSANHTWTFAANGDLTTPGLMWTKSDLSLNVAGGYFRGTGDTYIELFDTNVNNNIKLEPDSPGIEINADGSGLPSLSLTNANNSCGMQIDVTSENLSIYSERHISMYLSGGDDGVLISSQAGGPSPHVSAKLEVGSTTKGFLPPRMTTTERDAIATPAAGLMIYNSTTNKLNVYTTVWEAVTSI